MEHRFWLLAPLAALAAASLAGCVENLGGEGDAEGTATVCVLQDADVPGVERLLITFSRVELKEGAGAAADDDVDAGFDDDSDLGAGDGSGFGQEDRVAGQPAGGNETAGNETAGNETAGNETAGNETVGNETDDNATFGENDTLGNEDDADLAAEDDFEAGARVECVHAEADLDDDLFGGGFADDNATANDTANMTTNETGNDTGNATGNETGNDTGNETGNETGNDTGNETGFGEDDESSGQPAGGNSDLGAEGGAASGDDDSPGRGWVEVEMDGAVTIDLLDLETSTAAILATGAVPEGTYTQLRLVVDEATVVLENGTEENVTVPSGELKIIETFTVSEDEETEVLLDLQAEIALHQTGTGEWMLRPVVQTSVQSGDDLGATAVGDGNDTGQGLETRDDDSGEDASSPGAPGPGQGDEPPYP